MIKYAHIGYPKNFSTSLQRNFFSNNDQIRHLGIGLNDNLGYYDNDLNKIFETYLKTAKSYSYNNKKEHLKKCFNDKFEEARSMGYRACGVSSEHLSFAFTYDSLSADIKAERLQELMGADTKVIMIIRNQLDLIKSLYRESVRVGFKGDFEKYLNLFYKYQDRNYYSDLMYDWVYDTYCRLFGSENVHLLVFENYRESNGALINNGNNFPRVLSDLSEILNVDHKVANLEHYNKSLSRSQIINKALINENTSHDLGNHMYETAEKHRLKIYMEEDLSVFENEQMTYSDVLTKRKLIELSKHNQQAVESSLYSCDLNIWNKIKESYAESNKLLSAKLEINLPSSYF